MIVVTSVIPAWGVNINTLVSFVQRSESKISNHFQCFVLWIFLTFRFHLQFNSIFSNFYEYICNKLKKYIFKRSYIAVMVSVHYGLDVVNLRFSLETTEL